MDLNFNHCDGCPNLFGESSLFSAYNKKQKFPRIDDPELLKTLCHAEHPQILIVLTHHLNLKDIEKQLIHSGLGTSTNAGFSFHSIHYFLDALERPECLSDVEREAILPIIRAFLSEEITAVLSLLKEKSTQALIPKLCA